MRGVWALFVCVFVFCVSVFVRIYVRVGLYVCLW